MNRFDVIVVGGGINSLITASLLGKAGKKVVVLEARDQVGGLASTTEFAPGFKCNAINDIVKWIDPRITKQLDLESHGLSLIQPDTVRIALRENGKNITFHRDSIKTSESISAHSEKDGKVWSE